MKGLGPLIGELFFGSLLFFAITERGVHLLSSYETLAPHQNRLCLGECFTGKGTKARSFSIDWELSTDLDHSTRENVYSLRKRRVEERPELLATKYVPSRSIYSNIEDHLRWWGFDGYYKYIYSPNRGELSSAGKSLRGEEVLNPFDLVTVKPLTYTLANPRFRWSSNAAASAESGPCPYFPKKSAVRWTPGERRAEITYKVSEFAAQLESSNCVTNEIATDKLRLDIDPVNAQDLGLPFLALSKNDSANISAETKPGKIYRLNFFYHRCTSCGRPDGCNNISPLVEDFNTGKLKTTALPATLVLNLWEEQPESADAKPDFQYWIRLE